MTRYLSLLALLVCTVAINGLPVAKEQAPEVKDEQVKEEVTVQPEDTFEGTEQDEDARDVFTQDEEDDSEAVESDDEDVEPVDDRYPLGMAGPMKRVAVEEDLQYGDIVPRLAVPGAPVGLAVDDEAGRLVILHRAERPWDETTFDANNKFNPSLGPIDEDVIAVFDISKKDRDGNVEPELIGEYGTGMFYMPHGLSRDHEGNYWTTDVGSHQVHKMDKDFKIIKTFGEFMVPGNDSTHFCMPTDVSVSRNGDFFVADGYCNKRIVKLNATGALKNTIKESREIPFNVPHSLALFPTAEKEEVLCVADRDNERVECMHAGTKEGLRTMPTGSYVTHAEDIGRVYAIREKDGVLYGVTYDADGSQKMFSFDVNTKATSTSDALTKQSDPHAIAVSGDLVFVGNMADQTVDFARMTPNTKESEPLVEYENMPVATSE